MNLGNILDLNARDRRALRRKGIPFPVTAPPAHKPAKLSGYEKDLMKIRRTGGYTRPMIPGTSRPTTNKHNHTPRGAHYCPVKLTAGSDFLTQAIGKSQSRELHKAHGPCRKPWDGRGAVMKSDTAKRWAQENPLAGV